VKTIDFLSDLSPWIVLAMFLSLIFTVIIFVIIVSRKRLTMNSFKLLLLGVFTPVLGFVILSYMSSILLETVESSFEDNNLEIYVDGVHLIQDQKIILIDDFRSLYSFKKSGSHPTTVHKVKIISENYNLEFDFKADSRDKNVYWLYFPRYRLNGKIGMIKTDVISSVEQKYQGVRLKWHLLKRKYPVKPKASVFLTRSIGSASIDLEIRVKLI